VIVWPSPAKINLFLHIIGQRDDGYHLLQTAFQFLDYCDYLQFTVTEQSAVELSTPIPDVTQDQNLIIRAAKQLQLHTPCKKGAIISIDKHLPMGGGLGGGSSNAATVLVALNQLGSSHRIRAGQRLRLPAAGPAPQVTVAATPPPEPAVVASIAAPEAQPEVVEMAPGALAGDLAASMLGTIQTELLSDPSDYSVADDNTIEVQPLETLGHFGDWLEIKTQRLRDLNGFAFRTPVSVGQRIRLDLGTVDAKVFEEKRIAYHRSQQDSFFRQHIISDVSEHTIKRGESIWVIALRQYKVPVWLFRQYNPTIDMHKVQPGTTVQIPVLRDVDSD